MTIATLSDLTYISKLLRFMYLELGPSEYLDKTELWEELALSHINKDTVLFDHRGMFIVRDETLCVHKTKVWNGVSVYIKPEFRHTRCLQEYYKYLFENFKGRILGFTEVNSKHNKVLLKRHKLLGYVYELYRS
jgi:hypothetical protein